MRSIVILLSLVAVLCACKSTQTSSSNLLTPASSTPVVANTESGPVLFTMGQEPAYAHEFEYVFNKNNITPNEAVSRQEIDEYLDLYIKFRLKVKEAFSRGMHEDPNFQQELATYRKQLAQPYLTDSNAVNILAKEAHERLQEEVEASHILIGVGAQATAQDTLAAYKRISDIRQQALAGEDFNVLARRYSEDPSARSNGGNLGYFSALQLVYPFETTAYNLPQGQISEPVRTRFGYHLIKVTGKRKSKGKVQVAQIFVRAVEGMPAEDLEAAQKRIEGVYNLLEKGASWDSLVLRYSEHAPSASNKGILDPFGAGVAPPNIEKAAFALANPGDLAKPIRTVFGWHILKLIEKMPVKSYVEMEDELKRKVASDSRAALTRQIFLDSLRQRYTLTEVPNIIDSLTPYATINLVDNEWKPGAEYPKSLRLFNIESTAYTSNDFANYVINNQKQTGFRDAQQYMRVLYQRFKEDMLIAYEEEHLADRNYAYKMLLQEYRDGILLFDLMDEMVWSRATEDTAGLRQYFEANPDNYRWQERAQAIVLSSADQSLLDDLATILPEDLPTEDPSFTLLTEGAEDSLSLKGSGRLQLEAWAVRIRKDPRLTLQFSFNQTDAKALRLKQLALAYLNSQQVDSTRVFYVNTNTTDEGSIEATLYTSSKKSLENRFNQDGEILLTVDEGTYERGTREDLDAVAWQEGIQKGAKNNLYYVVYIKKVMPPAPKQLNEVRGQVISDYQKALEDEWLEALKKKYPVRVNKSVRKKVYNSLETK